jgi:predicted NAD/FAD-binding protein
MAVLLTGKKIAVIGGGIAGIYAAHKLQDHCEVTLFEAAAQLGGHTHPVLLPDQQTWVDTGFIVFNPHTYPLFMNWIAELGLEHSVIPMQMGFSFWDQDKDLLYGTEGLGQLFYQRKNAFNPAFYKMIAELMRFRKQACSDLEQKRLGNLTLGEYLAPYSALFRENLIAPTAAAVWSLPPEQIWDFPAQVYLQFQYNHQYLKGSEFKQARWLTFKGSSQCYLAAFSARFKGQIRTQSPIQQIVRTPAQVELHLADGQMAPFDAVVIATHADSALKLLAAPTAQEQALLGPWQYFEHDVYVHTDRSLLPPERKLWASWNLLTQSTGSHRHTTITYYLNQVQSLTQRQDFFLSLSPRQIQADQILHRFGFTHPILNGPAIQTQAQLPRLNGHHRSYFCGSYFGFGFHEDAIRSAQAVVESLTTQLEDSPT